MTTARTRLVALLGRPVLHSRSPEMMTRAFAALCLDAAYVAFEVDEKHLGAAVHGLRALGAAGANVTVPYKRAVLAHCDEVDPVAGAVGAANVLVPVEGGGLRACNTDAPATVAALQGAGVSLLEARAVVLGAGGAARAVAAGLLRGGVREVAVVARRLEQAAEVARDLSALPDAHGRLLRALSLGDEARVREAVGGAGVVVQATTAGMHRAYSGAEGDAEGHGRGKVTEAEQAVVETARWVGKGCAAMELVYAPRETPWLRLARERGARGVDGLEMLAHQGALALEHWFGVREQGRLLRRLLDESGTGE